MTTTLDYALYVLISIGVTVELIACLGLVVMRNAIDRLHYASAATGVGPAFIAAAVCIREGVVSAQGLSSILIALVLALAGGSIGIGVARVIRLRTQGTLEPSAAERERA